MENRNRPFRQGENMGIKNFLQMSAKLVANPEVFKNPETFIFTVYEDIKYIREAAKTDLDDIFTLRTISATEAGTAITGFLNNAQTLVESDLKESKDNQPIYVETIAEWLATVLIFLSAVRHGLTETAKKEAEDLALHFLRR